MASPKLLQFFLNKLNPVTQRECRSTWWSDPLSHPDIRAMDPIQIADLPMPKLPPPDSDRAPIA